jgi:phosphomannomutase
MINMVTQSIVPALKTEGIDTSAVTATCEKVKAKLQQDGAKFSDIDGVRVITKDGWWLLRASNTQPVLVARCEAADDAGLERLMTDLKTALAACGVELPDDASSGHH